jgi:hypothetical protein
MSEKWTAYQRDAEKGTNYWRIQLDDNSGDSLYGYCGERVARMIETTPHRLAEIARLWEINAELTAALHYAVHELEASGLSFDHPTIARLQVALSTANWRPRQ